MADRSRITVDATKRKYPTGDLYGIFFEDINHAADGGLYAEMIQNRSFEFSPIDNRSYNNMTAWQIVERDGGRAEGYVESEYPLNVNNTHYFRIRNIAEGAVGAVGVMNEGYNTGLPLRAGAIYKFSMFARRDINLKSPVEIILESVDGTRLGGTEIVVDSPEWKKYEATLTSSSENFSGRLVILLRGAGTLYLDMVSLFPRDTFMGRENGLRPDIAKFLADMKPKFVRFPGGCLTHDGTLDMHARDSMYRWKNTIGPLEARPTKRNNWQYNQTYGFGYYEFFLFCEDIGAKPLPVLPGAFNPHRQLAVPMDEMQAWVDDALDLLEFANGGTDTKWGAYRASLGHPEPFNVEYIAIGNEEVDEDFFERYPLFHKAIAEKYPNVKIINTAGPWAEGIGFDRGWESSRKWKSYAADEHYYVSPDWLIKNYDRYASDFYRKGSTKVFLGEYASRNSTFYNALCEAAYMTSFELNADVVALTCYAPLLCNADYVNWQPNLIWYDNHRVYGKPSYYVQKMYSVNQGDVTLEVSADITPADAYVEPKRIKGDFGFGAAGEAVFGKIKIDGSQIDASVVEVIDGDWKFKDGNLCRISHDDAQTPPAFPPRRRRDEADVMLRCTREDFTLEFTAKLSEKLPEPPPTGERRPRFRRGMTITFCDSGKDKFVWNIGGGRNNESIVDVVENTYGSRLATAPFELQYDNEYTIKIEKHGAKISCYIDGNVIHEIEYKPQPPRRIYASSTLDEKNNEVIIKAVNVRETPVTMDIVVEGAGVGPRTVKLETLTASSLDDTNTFEEPERVTTKYSSFEIDGIPFVYEFPASSVNIFRIPIIK